MEESSVAGIHCEHEIHRCKKKRFSIVFPRRPLHLLLLLLLLRQHKSRHFRTRWDTLRHVETRWGTLHTHTHTHYTNTQTHTDTPTHEMESISKWSIQRRTFHSADGALDSAGATSSVCVWVCGCVCGCGCVGTPATPDWVSRTRVAGAPQPIRFPLQVAARTDKKKILDRPRIWHHPAARLGSCSIKFDRRNRMARDENLVPSAVKHQFWVGQFSFRRSPSEWIKQCDREHWKRPRLDLVGLDLNWLLMRWLYWWHQRDDRFTYDNTGERSTDRNGMPRLKDATYSHRISPIRNHSGSTSYLQKESALNDIGRGARFLNWFLAEPRYNKVVEVFLFNQLPTQLNFKADWSSLQLAKYLAKAMAGRNQVPKRERKKTR